MSPNPSPSPETRRRLLEKGFTESYRERLVLHLQITRPSKLIRRRPQKLICLGFEHLSAVLTDLPTTCASRMRGVDESYPGHCAGLA